MYFNNFPSAGQSEIGKPPRLPMEPAPGSGGSETKVPKRPPPAAATAEAPPGENPHQFQGVNLITRFFFPRKIPQTSGLNLKYQIKKY